MTHGSWSECGGRLLLFPFIWVSLLSLSLFTIEKCTCSPPTYIHSCSLVSFVPNRLYCIRYTSVSWNLVYQVRFLCSMQVSSCCWPIRLAQIIEIKFNRPLRDNEMSGIWNGWSNLNGSKVCPLRFVSLHLDWNRGSCVLTRAPGLYDYNGGRRGRGGGVGGKESEGNGVTNRPLVTTIGFNLFAIVYSCRCPQSPSMTSWLPLLFLLASSLNEH